MRKISSIFIVALAGAMLSGQVTPSGSTLVTSSRLLDARAGAYRANHAVLVAGGRITAVGPIADMRRRAPTGTMTIDLGEATLLPGLIDTHAHVLSAMQSGRDAGANIVAAITEVGLAGRVRLGETHARELLVAGFTTVRNVGHSGVNGDVTVRDAIDAGSIPGPRILAAGRKITPPGGQAVANQKPPPSDAVVREEFIPISGVVEARRAVADLVAARVNVIKIVADDGPRVLDRGEIAAIVRAAHAARIRVAAHATSPEGVQAAIDGGVDSIEHADGATDAMLAAMQRKGIALGTTVWTAEALRDVFLGGRQLPEAALAGAEKEIAAITERTASLVRRAMQARLRLVAGSDMWMVYPGKPRGEATKMMFRGLARAGMSPAAVIRASTVDAAEVLGWADRVGSIERGRYADLIAVDGDPLADVAALDAVRFVMKGGQVVVGGP